MMNSTMPRQSALDLNFELLPEHSLYGALNWGVSWNGKNPES